MISFVFYSRDSRAGGARAERDGQSVCVLVSKEKSGGGGLRGTHTRQHEKEKTQKGLGRASLGVGGHHAHREGEREAFSSTYLPLVASSLTLTKLVCV